MKTFRIFWREYMNSSNYGNTVIGCNDMIEAIKTFEKAQPIFVIYQIIQEA